MEPSFFERFLLAGIGGRGTGVDGAEQKIESGLRKEPPASSFGLFMGILSPTK